MSKTLTDCIQYCQRRLGVPRFNFISVDQIRTVIIEDALVSFSQKIPYKTYYAIRPCEDAVDQERFPGLFRIQPEDCPPEKIYDVGMIFSSADIAIGGYPRDLGRTVYGGQMAIGALLYNQLNINLMSMGQPQQITCEYIQPNLVQVYPKTRFYSDNRPLVIELMVDHKDDLSTVPNAYYPTFRKLAEWYCKLYVYDMYKDWDDETVAGHQVRTKIQDYSDAQSKIDEIEDALQEEVAKNPDRIDFFVV